MVFFNYALRKLNAKIVYYGPGLCGKTTNLQWIHDHFDGGSRGKMISLATEGDRTIFFDLLPLDIGTIRGMEVTLQLYTVPGQVHYNSTRQLVLRGADGVVFVADSQRTMKSSNVESLKNLEENLRLQGIEVKEFPHVLQFNKRDLRDLLTIEEMDDDLNTFACPFFEGVATDGIGVQETLEGIVKLVMRKLRDRYEPLGTGSGRSLSAPSAPAPAAGPRPMPPGGGPQPMPPSAPQAPRPAAAAPPAVVAAPTAPASAGETLGMPPGGGFEASEDVAPKPEVVAYVESAAESVDQDNITTATFDDDVEGPAAAKPGADVDAIGRPPRAAARPPAAARSVDDLLAEATGASTIRVEDTAQLDEWREKAGIGSSPDAASESEDLSLADAQTDTGILFPSDDEEHSEPSFEELSEEPAEDPGPAFAVRDPGPAFAVDAGLAGEGANFGAEGGNEGREFPRWDGHATSPAASGVDEIPPDTGVGAFAGTEFSTEDPSEMEAPSDFTASAAEEPFAGDHGDDHFVDQVRAPSPFAAVPLTEVEPAATESADFDEAEAPFAAEVTSDPFAGAEVLDEMVDEEPENEIAGDEEPIDEIEMVEGFGEDEKSESPFGPAEEAAFEAVAEAERAPRAVGPPRADSVVFGGDEDPFADPFAMGDEPAPDSRAAARPEVSVLPAKVAAPRGARPEDTKLSLRLHGTGAIAEAGQVRELDIEVPVPGAWVGNQKVTLQLRLTLVPSPEDEDGI